MSSGRIRAGALERDVAFAHEGRDAAAVTDTYHARYDRYGPRIVGTVVVNGGGRLDDEARLTKPHEIDRLGPSPVR
jgi:hypothetical protein